QALVAHQDARQHPRLAQDLEAVAGTEHVAAVGDEIAQRLHHGGLAGHGARAQVVPVRKAAGKNHAVKVGEIAVAVPDVLHGLPPCRRARGLDVDFDELADAQLAQVPEAEAGERALHGRALHVEDPGLEADQDAELHAPVGSPTSRRYTSWYASSTPPRSRRKRSLSSFSRVARSQSRQVSGEISSPR